MVDQMAESQDPYSVINVKSALAYTAGDHEMLRELAELFLTEGPNQLRTIESEIAADNAAGIGASAHSLKGSVAIFAATEAIAAAAELERVAAEDRSLIPAAWTTLNEEMNRLIKDVQKLCGHRSN